MRAALPPLVLFAIVSLATTAAQSQQPSNTVRSAAHGNSPALDDCLKAAKSEVPASRAQAAKDLGRFNHEAQRAVPVLANLLNDGNGQVRMQAALALGKLGPESKAAVPKIARLLADPDYDVRMAGYITIAELGGDSQAVVSALLEDLPEEKSKGRISRELAEALGNIGPDAKGAVDVLERQQGDDSLGVLVTRSLVRISPNGKEEILRSSSATRSHYTRHVMRDPQFLPPEPKAHLRLTFVRMHDLPTDVKEAVPSLALLLGDKDHRVRQWAAQALALIGPDSKTAVPELTKLLKDDEPYVRQCAAEALGDIGPEARPAAPALEELLKDKLWANREAAAAALGKIGPGAETTVLALDSCLQDRDPNVIWAAIAALRATGREPKPTIARLEELLSYSDTPIRPYAVEALGKLGPEAKDAVEDLLKVMHDVYGWARLDQRAGDIASLSEAPEDENTPLLAWDALCQIGPAARKSLPSLVKFVKGMQFDGSPTTNEGDLSEEEMIAAIVHLMDDNSGENRSRGKRLWNVLGPEDIPALKALVQGKGQSISGPRMAVEKLGDFGAAAAAALAEIVKSADPKLRREVIETIGQIGPHAAEAAATAVGKALRDDDPTIRSAAAVAMGYIGRDSKPAVLALIASLKDSDCGVQTCAIEALGRIGPHAQEATAGLIEALHDGHSPVRAAAARAIGRIGPGAKAAAPALEKLRQDPQDYVRTAAAEAQTAISE